MHATPDDGAPVSRGGPVTTDAVALRDLDRARAVGGAAYYPHSLTCIGDPADFAMHLRAVELGPLLAGVLSYDVQVHIETAGELGSAYEINVPLAGPMECWAGGRHAVGSPDVAVVNGPDSTSTLRGFGRHRPLLGLKVDRRALEAQYQVLHDRPVPGPPVLRPTIALDRGPGAQWWSLIGALRTAMDDPGGLLSSPLVARPLVESVLRGLLIAGGTEPVAERDRARPAAVRAAVEFIRTRAHEPLTIGEIAAAAGCGVRTLQQAFRTHLGLTPMAYLQRERLAGAHAELLAAGPDHTTVTDVCWRWGFTHAGRFAAAYRRRYGIHPSSTLHA